MRIYVVASLKGGLAPFTRRDLAGLAQKGHDVFVLPTKIASDAVVPAGLHLAYKGRLARAVSALVGLCRLLGAVGTGGGVAHESMTLTTIRNYTTSRDLTESSLLHQKYREG